MQAFEFEALDTKGQKKRGMINADDARTARQLLKDRNLFPIEVEAAAKTRARSGQYFRDRLSAKQKTMMTRQLATLVRAGSPVEEALDMVAKQTESRLMRRIVLSVRKQVVEGQNLSGALASENASFDPLFRSMVFAGEKSGDLGHILDRIADYLERSEAIRSKIQTALIYPVALALVAMGVITILMVYVVPKVVAQFANMGQALPPLTQTMIAISDFVQQYGLWVLAAIVFSIFIFTKLLKQSAFAFAVDRFVLRLPLIGRFVRDVFVARFARTLATLVASGSPLVEALKAARHTLSNRLLRQDIEQVINHVEEGASLSAALKRLNSLPPMLAYMIAAGENSGQVDIMLQKAADYMDREFEAFTAAALSLLEPAIIIVMGALVALIVLAILMPILQMNTLAGF